MDFNAALNQLEAWPVEDRINFIEAAWDRLVSSGFDPSLTEPQRAELDKRIEQGGSLTSWDEIKNGLQSS